MSQRSLKMASALAGCVALAAMAAAPALAAPGKAQSSDQGQKSRLQTLQVLSISDFHGSLLPGTIRGMEGKYGGVAYLSTHLNQLREGQSRSITLANGDNVGASPLISAAFHDEPTIEAFNLMGFDGSTIGNHEFDEGYKEMLRLINGGCLPDGDGKDNQNSCPDGTYTGADFPFVAANVFYAGTNKTLLPPYTVINEKGIKVGIIGAVLKDTPNIVTASGVAGLTFTDEVEAINKASAELTKKGVNTQIVLVHEGAYPSAGDPAMTAQCAEGSQINGALVPIAKKTAASVDYIVAGHAHSQFVCTIADPAGMPRLVTESRNYGQVVTEALLPYDPATKDIVRGLATAKNHMVTNTVKPDPRLQSLVDRYSELVKPIADRVIGSLSAPAYKDPAAGYGDGSLGNLIADAQLADTTVVSGGKAPQIAFMNPGGIRQAMLDQGPVTFGEAFAIQPFNNYLVSMDLTGAQIYQILAEQVTGKNDPAAGGFHKILQVSKGFTYTLGATGAVEGSVKLNGTPIDKATTYRVVANIFLSDGGDGFGTFAKGTNKLIGGLDIDAFANYLTANNPYQPVASSRIVKA